MAGLGDHDFESFAHAELPRLLGLARLLAGNDHDAWDLVQDCLIRVGGRWQRIDRERNPQAYARRTLVNLNHNRRRRLKRELLTERPTNVHVDRGGGHADLDAWLDKALQSLPRQQRAVVALAYLEDLSVAQIAGILGCSTSTVKTHLARGRAALRTAANDHAQRAHTPAASTEREV